ncbi:hypothetical protein [Phenylobacterium sp.]|uniref:hypothetical protein n=1 Tax=Phenylobacterium sp. TaxID=1871053 RepID=UPI00301BA0FD
MLGAAVAASLSVSSAWAQPPAPAISITLKPVAADGEVRTIEVRETLTGYAGQAGRVLLEVPARITLTPGQAYAETDIAAEDDAGPLKLTMAVEPAPPGFPLELRTFTPTRDTKGPIRLRYSATIAGAMTPRKPGPSYDLRGTGGGFGGAPWTFVLLPRGAAAPADLTFAWDFAGLPAQARAVSVRGEGDLRWRGPPGSLYTMFFLAGRVDGYAPPGSRFHAYWIGRPPFDAQAAAQWSARSFTALQGFFRDRDARPYTLLMRPYARPRDGGAATQGGFILEYGVGEMSDDARRIMFTHEMVHHFVGGLDGNSSATAWFGEGLAEFYKIRLPLRAGLIGLDAAAEQIAVMTDAYYGSPTVATPYGEVARQRWAGEAAQNTPYSRGFMYFVTVDAAVRAASKGHRSLDDLVLAMLDSRRAGQGYDERRWRALLQAELGDTGVAAFDSMLGGRVLEPPADAFGPCFVRATASRPRPVLGFSEDSILSAPHVVADLEPGSNAEAAGLRNGDVILRAAGAKPRIAHSASNLALQPRVDLTVQRADQELPVSFSTEGPTVLYHRWSLVGARGASCVL